MSSIKEEIEAHVREAVEKLSLIDPHVLGISLLQARGLGQINEMGAALVRQTADGLSDDIRTVVAHQRKMETNGSPMTGAECQELLTAPLEGFLAGVKNVFGERGAVPKTHTGTLAAKSA